MKKKFIIFIAMILIAFSAILTNPKKEDYVTWLKETAVKQSTNSLEKGLVSFLGGPLLGTTQTHNYVFFTIYDTNIDKDNIKVIGVFNNFIPIAETKVSK
jgi:hypothetical protein